jgi:hypothetical protein
MVNHSCAQSLPLCRDGAGPSVVDTEEQLRFIVAPAVC